MESWPLRHWPFSLRRPQSHCRVTSALQRVAGQGVSGWHGAWHGWPHSLRVIGHGWVHTLPSRQGPYKQKANYVKWSLIKMMSNNNNKYKRVSMNRLMYVLWFLGANTYAFLCSTILSPEVHNYAYFIDRLLLSLPNGWDCTATAMQCIGLFLYV